MNRIVSTFVTLIVGALFAASLILAPEATVRAGDFLPLTLAWSLLLAAVPVIFVLVRGRDAGVGTSLGAKFTLGTVFALIVLFFAASMHAGNPLFGANMRGTVLAMPLFYLLLVVLGISSPKGTRLRQTLLTVLLAAAMAESAFACFCYTVKDPAIRAEYRANPEKVLAENGIYFEPGSPERTLFENRLLHSVEPLGTYGLTNTLAGVLTPVITLLFGRIFWNVLRRTSDQSERKKRLVRVAAAVVSLIPLGATVMLTKSRSAYGACFLGAIFSLFACFWIFYRTSDRGEHALSLVSRRRFRRILLTLLILFIALPLIAFWCGLLDREVFTEAKKSLGYRLDYWQGATRMIADHPFLGVGPGNFQASYPQYMNATASEVVADPHHFLLETAAVFGIPTALFFCFFIAAVAYQALFQKIPESEPESEPEKGENSARFPVVTATLAFGAGVAGVFAYSQNASAPIDFDFLLAAVPALGIAIAAAFFLFDEPIPKPFFLAALAASLVNLSAAGGIFLPAVGFEIWLFAAFLYRFHLSFSVTPVPTPPDHEVVRGWIGKKSNVGSITPTGGSDPATNDSDALPGGKKIAFRAAAVLFAALPFLLSGFIGIDIQRNRAEKRQLEEAQSAPTRLEAISCLSLRDSIPVSQLRFSQSLAEYAEKQSQNAQDKHDDNQRSYERSKEILFTTAPQSAPVRFAVGKEELAVYERTGRTEFLTQAAGSFAEAVARFGTNAEYRAYWGLTLHRLGQTTEALEQLKKALELDNAMPHRDRKLAPNVRRAVESAVSKI